MYVLANVSPTVISIQDVLKHYYCSTFVIIPPTPTAAGSSGGVAMPVGSKVVLESPGSSEHNEEEESPDLDMDYLEDYDSDEEKRSHRKRKRVCVPFVLSI